VAIFAFSLVCAYAFLGYLVFALGLTGLCRPAFVSAAAAPALVALAVILIREFRKPRPPAVRIAYLAAALVLALLYSHAFLIPPYTRDDMIYHLLIPKQMALTGRLAFDPFNVTGNFPMLFEMPFAVLETLRMPVSPFVANVAFAVLIMMVLLASLSRISGLSRAQALAVTAVFATTPVLIDLLHSGYVEIFFALLITLATLAYLRVLETGVPGTGVLVTGNSSAWLRACACLGLAAAVKYPGVLFAVFFFAWEFFRSRDRKNFYAGVLLCAALAAPWYLKNWFWTGNPVFPLANSLFESPYFSALRFQGFHHMLADYNMGRSPLDLLLLPFRLALGIDEARPGAGLGFDGKLSLLFAIALCGLGWKDRGQRFASALFAFYFLIWIVESQQVRFLLAILPVPVLFALRRAARLPRPALWIFAGAGLILAQNAVNVSERLRSEKITPLFTGATDGPAFLAAQMPLSYGLASEINKRLDAKSDKLMTVGCFGRNYYFDIPVLTNTFYDQEIFRNSFGRGDLKPDSVTAFLRGNRVTYILFNWDFVRKMHAQDVNFDFAALETYLKSTCRVVSGSGNVFLYGCGRLIN